MGGAFYLFLVMRRNYDHGGRVTSAPDRSAANRPNAGDQLDPEAEGQERQRTEDQRNSQGHGRQPNISLDRRR
jgi:hypothetical protein